MRKIIFLIHLSLDGFAAGPNGEMDWIIYNEDMEKYSHELHNTTDTAIYGRVTYQMMESYWPAVLTDPTSTQGELNHARWLDAATKVVVSKTIKSLQWNNSVLISDNVGEEIIKLKQQPGKDMWLIGSPSLAQSLIQLNLIDEYRININPVILGKGQRLFPDNHTILNLKLLEAKWFSCGVVALRYEPITAAKTQE